MYTLSCHVVRDVGQQSQVTSTLDGLSDTTLELEASACDAARKDLTLLVEEALEEFGILIVDILDTALLEAAVLLLLAIEVQWGQIAYFSWCSHFLVSFSLGVMPCGFFSSLRMQRRTYPGGRSGSGGRSHRDGTGSPVLRWSQAEP